MEEQNRFQKNDARRAAKRSGWNSDSTNAREEIRKQQRESWISPSRSSRTNTKDGIALDPQTQAAKAAYEAKLAERQAAKSAPQQAPLVAAESTLTPEEVGVLAHRWVQANPDFYDSDYNAVTLKAIVDAFKLPHTAAGFTQGYQYGVQHNHFEQPPVRKRGYPESRRAPVPFVPPTPPTPKAEPVRSGQTPVYIRQEISAEEHQALRTMPLDELRKLAREGQNRGKEYRG